MTIAINTLVMKLIKTAKTTHLGYPQIVPVIGQKGVIPRIKTIKLIQTQLFFAGS